MSVLTLLPRILHIAGTAARYRLMALAIVAGVMLVVVLKATQVL